MLRNFGLIELLAGKYLIVITEQSLIGSLPEVTLKSVKSPVSKIIPCGFGLKELSPPLQADEKEFLSLWRNL